MSYAYDTIADIIRLAEENNISFWRSSTAL